MTTGYDDQLIVWDWEQGASKCVVKGIRGFETASFARDGASVLAIALGDEEGRYAGRWSATSGDLIIRIRSSNGNRRFESVEFSPSGQRILTSSYDHTARVFESRSGEEVFMLTGHASFVLDATYSPDGKFIATASHDRKAGIWDADNGTLIAVLEEPGSVQKVLFDPSSKRLLTHWSYSGDEPSRHGWSLWALGEDAKSPKRVKEFPESAEIIGFINGGAEILSVKRDKPHALYNADTGEIAREYAK